MNNHSYHLVISKIEIIEKTEQLLIKLREIKDEPLGKSMIMEMERKKRNLLKELLKEMIDADMIAGQFESSYQKILSYLNTSKSKNDWSEESKLQVARVEKFLEVNI